MHLDSFGEHAAKTSATLLEELTLDRKLASATSVYHLTVHCMLSKTSSSAKDQLMGTSVAIKKIMKPFSTPVLSKRTYRELKLLKHIQHENVCPISFFLFSFAIFAVATSCGFLFRPANPFPSPSLTYIATPLFPSPQLPPSFG